MTFTKRSLLSNFATKTKAIILTTNVLLEFTTKTRVDHLKYGVFVFDYKAN